MNNQDRKMLEIAAQTGFMCGVAITVFNDAEKNPSDKCGVAIITGLFSQVVCVGLTMITPEPGKFIAPVCFAIGTFFQLRKTHNLRKNKK